MDEYIIQGSTLRNLADQARLLTGESGTMSPAEIAAAFADAAANGTGISGEHDEMRYYDRENEDTTSVIYTPPLVITMTSDAFTNAINDMNMTELSLPRCTSIDSDYSMSELRNLTTLDLPAITVIGSRQCAGLVSLTTVRAPACTQLGERAFADCGELATVILNSACCISNRAFVDVLDPDSKTLRIYFVGETCGSCSPAVFGDIWGDSGGTPLSDDPPQRGGEIPGLEIYVPASMAESFRNDWAEGLFAENIYPLPATLP